MRLAPGIILFSALGITAVCSAEEVDLSAVSRIKDQAFNHSQVMDYMHYLAPREPLPQPLPEPQALPEILQD